MYYYLFTNNTLSPTLSLKSPENFGKFNDREVPVSATFVKSLSQAAASKLSFFCPTMVCFVLFHSRESDGFMRPDRSWHLFQGRTGVDKEEKLHFFYLSNFQIFANGIHNIAKNPRFYTYGRCK